MRPDNAETCFTVALYGTALAQADIVPLAGEVVALWRAAGVLPTHLTVTARGFGDKPLHFDRAWPRLHRTAPGDVRSLGVHAMCENWNTLGDWAAVCDIHQDLACLVLGAGLAAMPDAEPRIVALIRRWLDRIRPGYGIGFFRKRGDGPSLYAIGASCTTSIHNRVGAELEEDRATRRWCDGMDEAVFERGILRDIHPYSLLCARHLDRDVGGMSLRAWIEGEPWRGELAACADGGYTLWTVGQESLAAVRYQLAAAGALYVLAPDNHLDLVTSGVPFASEVASEVASEG